MAKAKETMLRIPVSWGGVGLNKESARIGAKFARSACSFSQVDKMILGKRITCRVTAAAGNDNPDQPPLEGMKQIIEKTVTVDVKGVNVTKKNITLGLTLDLDAMSGDEFAEFVGRAGAIEIEEITDIPAKGAKKEDDE